jgi:hypothetical protein
MKRKTQSGLAAFMSTLIGYNATAATVMITENAASKVLADAE